MQTRSDISDRRAQARLGDRPMVRMNAFHRSVASTLQCNWSLRFVSTPSRRKCLANKGYRHHVTYTCIACEMVACTWLWAKTYMQNQIVASARATTQQREQESQTPKATRYVPLLHTRRQTGQHYTMMRTHSYPQTPRSTKVVDLARRVRKPALRSRACLSLGRELSYFSNCGGLEIHRKDDVWIG